MKYESLTSSGKEALTNNKVNRSKLLFPRKGLVTRNVHMKYESPISSGKEAMVKVKVFKSSSHFKVKVTRIKMPVSTESSCHMEYTCEI